MKSILFPIDNSKDLNMHIQYAIQFAHEKDCKLVFFHAFHDPNIEKIGNKKNHDILISEIDNKTYKLNDEIKKIYNLLKIPFSVKNNDLVIKFGKNVIDLIDQTVFENKIDLVIIGTQHLTGIKSFLFENKAVKLISILKVPVLILPVGYKFITVNKIIYSTDLLNTKKELDDLNSINEIFKSEIQLVYFDNGIAKTKQELENKKLIETLEIPFEAIKVNIDFHLITDLKDFLKSKRNIAVCLFHSPKNIILKLLRLSNTGELALNLNTPLLSIRR